MINIFTQAHIGYRQNGLLIKFSRWSIQRCTILRNGWIHPLSVNSQVVVDNNLTYRCISEVTIKPTSVITTLIICASVVHCILEGLFNSGSGSYYYKTVWQISVICICNLIKISISFIHARVKLFTGKCRRLSDVVSDHWETKKKLSFKFNITVSG